MLKVLSTLLTSAFLLNSAVLAADPMREKSEVGEILQQLIDAPQLARYYHVDTRPERSPLRLRKTDALPQGLQLSKFGKSVEVLPAGEPQGPHMEISTIEVQGSSAKVAFKYPPEGLVGTALLSRKGGAWVLESLSLHER